MGACWVSKDFEPFCVDYNVLLLSNFLFQGKHFLFIQNLLNFWKENIMVLLVIVLFLMLICHCVEWLLIFAAETAFLFSSFY